MRAGTIAGLIVAAGYSSRMGTFKPLLTLGNKTVIEMAVDSLRQGGVQDIRVVTGHRSGELNPVLEHLNVRVIENTKFADGMYSSIVAGLRTMTGEVEACFLLPGDNPLIRRHSIKNIVRIYRKTGATVIYPVFNDQRGHPPLIKADCFPFILGSSGLGGLKNVLTQFNANSVEVALADQGVVSDIDTAEDYKKLLEYHARREIPTYRECLALINKYHSDGLVLRHGQRVAEVGRRIAMLLNKAGMNLNLDLVIAGSLVHDVAKGKHRHAKQGERLLASMEFSALADIVGSHMNLYFADDSIINETAIVFLADKLVQGDMVVSLSDRFAPALARFAGNQAAMAAIRTRMQTAEALQKRVEDLLGIGSLNEVLLG